jgi:hypothetical protein
MKRFIFSVLLASSFLSFSLADTIILNRTGYSTYIQEVEYPLSEGINDIGPITLKPFADTRGIRIEGKGIEVKSYIIRNSGNNWKEKLLGKYVEIKGNGRTIKGKVVSIENNFIEISTKKGYTLTTLPKFPSRLNSPLTWQEIYSPQIDVRIKSNNVETKTIKIIYPLKNINWKPEYVLKNDRLEIYVSLVNNTPVSLEGVDIEIKGFFRPIRLHSKTLDKFSIKRIKVYSGKIANIARRLHGTEVIAVYQGNQFIGYKKLNELFK